MTAADGNPLYQFIWDAQNEATNSQINGYAECHPRDLLAHCDRMIHCLSGFDSVFLMSLSFALEQRRGLDDEWLDGFNSTFELLCLAGAERDIDLDPFKELAIATYSFWKDAIPVREMEGTLRRLYHPGIAALHDLKRRLIVECGNLPDPVYHNRIKKSAIRRAILTLGILLFVEVVIGCLVWRYGEGANLFRRLTNAWPWLGAGFGAVVISYPFLMGRDRMRLLKWWKGEADQTEITKK